MRLPTLCLSVLILALAACGQEQAPATTATPAATPAAPPATRRSRGRNALECGKNRCAACRMEAATCTDGPSRPAEKPPIRANAPRTILPIAMRRETNALTDLPSAACRVATMTCGIPLPWIPGK